VAGKVEAIADRCGIFLIHRRSEAAGHARAPHLDLCRRFDRERVFFDRATIESGDDFPDRLRDGISLSLALVALIGFDCLDARDRDGKRRLARVPQAELNRLTASPALIRQVLMDMLEQISR
jgi:hypothetical protein